MDLYEFLNLYNFEWDYEKNSFTGQLTLEVVAQLVDTACRQFFPGQIQAFCSLEHCREKIKWFLRKNRIAHCFSYILDDDPRNFYHTMLDHDPVMPKSRDTAYLLKYTMELFSEKLYYDQGPWKRYAPNYGKQLSGLLRYSYDHFVDCVRQQETFSPSLPFVFSLLRYAYPLNSPTETPVASALTACGEAQEVK